MSDEYLDGITKRVPKDAHPGTRGESPDEWYEREKTAFRAWWESEGEKTFSRTPTLAAGAGWFARAEAAPETAPIVPCLATNGCTTPEWCARNSDACRVKTPVSEIAQKPSVPNPCSVCGIPIFGSTVGTGDGSMKDGGSFAHPECYWRDQARIWEQRCHEEEKNATQHYSDLMALRHDMERGMANHNADLNASVPSATPCSGQHLSKDLHEALEFIKKLSAVISATHPDAFKGWARGEHAPYDLAKAADNFVHQPRSVFPPSTPDGEFTVGDYTLREGMERGKVWIEHESGEGGDFTATKVEAAIAAFYKEHF